MDKSTNMKNVAWNATVILDKNSSPLSEEELIQTLQEKNKNSNFLAKILELDPVHIVECLETSTSHGRPYYLVVEKFHDTDVPHVHLLGFNPCVPNDLQGLFVNLLDIVNILWVDKISLSCFWATLEMFLDNNSLHKGLNIFDREKLDYALSLFHEVEAKKIESKWKIYDLYDLDVFSIIPHADLMKPLGDGTLVSKLRWMEHMKSLVRYQSDPNAKSYREFPKRLVVLSDDTCGVFSIGPNGLGTRCTDECDIAPISADAILTALQYCFPDKIHDWRIDDCSMYRGLYMGVDTMSREIWLFYLDSDSRGNELMHYEDIKLLNPGSLVESFLFKCKPTVDNTMTHHDVIKLLQTPKYNIRTQDIQPDVLEWLEEIHAAIHTTTWQIFPHVKKAHDITGWWIFPLLEKAHGIKSENKLPVYPSLKEVGSIKADFPTNDDVVVSNFPVLESAWYIDIPRWVWFFPALKKINSCRMSGSFIAPVLEEVEEGWSIDVSYCTRLQLPSGINFSLLTSADKATYEIEFFDLIETLKGYPDNYLVEEEHGLVTITSKKWEWIGGFLNMQSNK
jgi:hypothetical protein